MGMGNPTGSFGQQQGQQGQQGQQYTPGTFGPQNPQGFGALQNAYQQFQNGAPPQPNPMFGQQPSGMQQGNLRDASRGGGMQQNPMTQAGMQAQKDFGAQRAFALQQMQDRHSPMGAVSAGGFGQANPQFAQPAYQPGVIPGMGVMPDQGPMTQAGMQQGNLQGAPLGGGMPQWVAQYQQDQQNPTGMQQQMGGGMPPQGRLSGLPPQAIANSLRGNPLAPATQQTRPEDPRMTAMRHMQQMKLGGR